MVLLVAEGKTHLWVDLVDRDYCKALLWILFVSMVKNNFRFKFSTLQSSTPFFFKHLQCTSDTLFLHISQVVQFDKNHISLLKAKCS